MEESAAAREILCCVNLECIASYTNRDTIRDEKKRSNRVSRKTLNPVSLLVQVEDYHSAADGGWSVTSGNHARLVGI